MPAPELFVPFHYPTGKAPLASHVRSTLVVSSLQSLRARGLLESYSVHLSPRDQEELFALIAGTWIPVELGAAHYRALDEMKLPAEVVEAIGGDVAQRVNKSLLSTIIRASRGMGVTPWTLLSHVHRFRQLSWQGSDITVLKLGPKDARFDWISQPLAAIPYFVTSLGGYLAALCNLFSAKAYARVEGGRGQHRVTYRLSWA